LRAVALLAALVAAAVAAGGANAGLVRLTLDIRGAGSVNASELVGHAIGTDFVNGVCTSTNPDDRVVGKTCFRTAEDIFTPAIKLTASPASPSSNWRFGGWQGCSYKPADDSQCQAIGADFSAVNVHVTVTFDDYRAPVASFSAGPTGLVPTGLATFHFSSDESGSLQCRLDAGAWGGCTSPYSTAVGNGLHAFRIQAIDPSGNVGAEATRSWTVDFPPDTGISGGPTGRTASAAATFTFGSPDPDVAPWSYQCRLDSGAWLDCSSPRAYSGLAEGSHTFEVRARDAVNNIDPTPAVRSWIVDFSPETTIDGGPTGVTASPVATFLFSSVNGDVTGYECRLDAGAWAACSSPHSIAGLLEGSHVFTVRAKDLGSVDPTPAQRTWSVDTVAPVVTIAAGPSGPVGSSETNATFAFLGDEAGVTFRCSLDGAPYSDCVSPVSYFGLAAGTHGFSVQARDAAGNVSTAASRAWTIAAPAPPAPPAGPPPAPQPPPASPPPPRTPVVVVRCVVPKVSGKTLAAARTALKRKKCAVGKVRKAYSGRVKKGRVVAQSVKPGKRLARGAKVGLVVSRGKR
jgi:hypothetical protein